MNPQQVPLQPRRRQAILTALILGGVVACMSTLASGQPAKPNVLRIGATGTLTGDPDSPREKAGTDMLHRFIKDETGLDNEIVGERNWRELVDDMAQGRFHLAVFQGFEFAWAQELQPQLQPLTLAINVDRYPVACVVVARSNPARDITGLRDQSFSLPITCHAYLRLFVEKQCESQGAKLPSYFGRINTPDNIEDALDEVIDGVVQGVVVDGGALELYRQRKPGRFKQLKEIARSQPFPPVLIAYYGSVVDQATLRKFKDGMLAASHKSRGEMLLTLSRVTGFEAVPEDFVRVLAETRKAYPPPGEK